MPPLRHLCNLDRLAGALGRRVAQAVTCTTWVLDAKAEPTMVKAYRRHGAERHDNELVKLQTESSGQLVVTSSHKVMVQCGLRQVAAPARDLSVGSDVICGSGA